MHVAELLPVLCILCDELYNIAAFNATAHNVNKKAVLLQR